MDSNDLLYVVFEKLLMRKTQDEQQLEDFSQEVVAEYLMLLAKQGITVPQKLRPVLEMDLIEEVIDMARKKTYGHSSLQEYRLKNVEAIEKFLKRAA